MFTKRKESLRQLYTEALEGKEAVRQGKSITIEKKECLL
jgi:hypothetical protein